MLSTSELISAKIKYADIKQLLDEGYIEKIRRGYYQFMPIYEAFIKEETWEKKWDSTKRMWV